MRYFETRGAAASSGPEKPEVPGAKPQGRRHASSSTKAETHHLDQRAICCAQGEADAGVTFPDCFQEPLVLLDSLPASYIQKHYVNNMRLVQPLFVTLLALSAGRVFNIFSVLCCNILNIGGESPKYGRVTSNVAKVLMLVLLSSSATFRLVLY